MSKIYHHVVSEMENLVQRCVICGEIISDYRNASWPISQGPPKGFPAGDLYIQGKNPTSYFQDLRYIEEGDEVINCKERRTYNP